MTKQEIPQITPENFREKIVEQIKNSSIQDKTMLSEEAVKFLTYRFNPNISLLGNYVAFGGRIRYLELAQKDMVGETLNILEKVVEEHNKNKFSWKKLWTRLKRQ